MMRALYWLLCKVSSFWIGRAGCARTAGGGSPQIGLGVWALCFFCDISIRVAPKTPSPDCGRTPPLLSARRAGRRGGQTLFGVSICLTPPPPSRPKYHTHLPCQPPTNYSKWIFFLFSLKKNVIYFISFPCNKITATTHNVTFFYGFFTFFVTSQWFHLWLFILTTHAHKNFFLTPYWLLNFLRLFFL